MIGCHYCLRTALLCASIFSGLAACTAPVPHRDVASRMTVPYVEAQHSYHFAAAAGSLSSAQRHGINNFFKSLALQEGDAVFVTIPTSGKVDTDASRRAAMAAALAFVPGRINVLMDISFAPRSASLSQTGLIRIARAQGIQVSCRPSIDDLGCATATNLAIMIHQPGDVLMPAATARNASR